jgi:hypothetical protein
LTTASPQRMPCRCEYSETVRISPSGSRRPPETEPLGRSDTSRVTWRAPVRGSHTDSLRQLEPECSLAGTPEAGVWRAGDQASASEQDGRQAVAARCRSQIHRVTVVLVAINSQPISVVAVALVDAEALREDCGTLGSLRTTPQFPASR